MKATITIPDDLYRRVRAMSALESRAVREVTEARNRAWPAEGDAAATPRSGEAWLAEWIREGGGGMAGRSS